MCVFMWERESVIGWIELNPTTSWLALKAADGILSSYQCFIGTGSRIMLWLVSGETAAGDMAVKSEALTHLQHFVSVTSTWAPLVQSDDITDLPYMLIRVSQRPLDPDCVMRCTAHIM